MDLSGVSLAQRHPSCPSDGGTRKSQPWNDPQSCVRFPSRPVRPAAFPPRPTGPHQQLFRSCCHRPDRRSPKRPTAPSGTRAARAKFGIVARRGPLRKNGFSDEMNDTSPERDGGHSGGAFAAPATTGPLSKPAPRQGLRRWTMRATRFPPPLSRTWSKLRKRCWKRQ